MEAKKSGLLPFCNSFSKNAIEERITAIMKTKKVTFGIFIISAAIIISTTTLFATSAKESESNLILTPTITAQEIEELAASISYSEGRVSFTIPATDETWNIWISGRMELEGFGGMSVHYLTDVSENNGWESGKTYSFDVSDGTYTELNMDIQLDGQEVSINIMEFLPENLQKLSDPEEEGETTPVAALTENLNIRNLIAQIAVQLRGKIYS